MCKLILLYEKNIVTAIWSACFCVNVGSCYHCQQLSFTEIVLLKYLLVVRRQNVQNDNHLLSRKSARAVSSRRELIMPATRSMLSSMRAVLIDHCQTSSL